MTQTALPESYFEELNISQQSCREMVALANQLTLSSDFKLCIYPFDTFDNEDLRDDPREFVYVPTMIIEDDVDPDDTGSEYTEFRDTVSDEYYRSNLNVAERLGDHLVTEPGLNIEFFFSEFYLTKLFLKGRKCRHTDAYWFTMVIDQYLRYHPEKAQYIYDKCWHATQSSGLFTYLLEYFEATWNNVITRPCPDDGRIACAA